MGQKIGLQQPSKDEELKRQELSYWDVWQATPFMTTKQTTTYARDFNNIETRAVIKFLFLHGKAPKEIHAILTETLACFLPGRTKDLSAPL